MLIAPVQCIARSFAPRDGPSMLLFFVINTKNVGHHKPVAHPKKKKKMLRGADRPRRIAMPLTRVGYLHVGALPCSLGPDPS